MNSLKYVIGVKAKPFFVRPSSGFDFKDYFVGFDKSGEISLVRNDLNTVKFFDTFEQAKQYLEHNYYDICSNWGFTVLDDTCYINGIEFTTVNSVKVPFVLGVFIK